MGKRIPGKKHRGVKDPLVQQAVREESLKHRINAPPKDNDYQEIPKSVERLMKLKQMTKEGMFNKHKKKKNKNKNKLMDTSKLMDKEKILPGMTKPDRNLPVLVQKPGESNRSFIHRVHQATQEFVKEVKFESKYNMKMRKDEKTGEVKFDKVEMDPIDKMFQDKLLATTKQKNKKKKQLRGNVSMEGLSKTARRRKKLLEKRERIGKIEGERGGEDGFEKLQDKVAFNEVVHRPPQLTALPRKADVSSVARRPGSKPGLLLAHMMSGDGQKRDLTGRRKDLSMSDRRRLDSAQAAAIEAYRQLKAKRSTAIT